MLAFLPTVGFYCIQRESLLIRSPSADMWRACVFIFPAKPHPVLQSGGLCGALPALCPQTSSLIRFEPRLHALCLCRPLARRRRTRLLLIFHIPLSKPSICEEVGGVCGGGEVQQRLFRPLTPAAIGFNASTFTPLCASVQWLVACAGA